MSLHFSEGPDVGMTGGTPSRTQIYVIGTVFVAGGFPTVPPSLALPCGSQSLRTLGSLSTKSSPAPLFTIYFLCAALISLMTGTRFMVLSRAHRGTRERGSFSWTDPAQIPGSWLGTGSLRSGFLSREQRVELACGLLNGVTFL